MILAFASVSLAAARQAAPTLPIVALDLEADPIAIGAAQSLNRPGGNVTGVVFTSVDLTAKRLGLLHELVPKPVSIAALSDPAAP